MYSQMEFAKDIDVAVDEFKEELPEAFAAQKAFNDAIYKDGALSSRIKRLMAMSMAVRLGCPACINFQMRMAIEAGATRDEIIEAASVATAMGGTSGGNAWVWIVVKMLKELGMW